MTQRVIVRQEGRMLDELVLAAVGADDEGRVEATLSLNPGLSAELARAGHVLALGRAVATPERGPAVRRVATIRLWD